MKRKSAVFTIVKNEDYFLPIWLSHYKRFFADQDIYVLDHQSDDGSTENLDVNRITVQNEVAFDHQWLVNVVEQFQRVLLEKYECVLFAESDEILYSVEKGLDEMIDTFLAEENDYIVCNGYELTQNLGVEPPLGRTDAIMPNRNYWFPNGQYNKPLLTKKPLSYVWGFHNTAGYPDHGDRYGKYGFTMVHLHRHEFELMIQRKERASKWNIMEKDSYASWHNKTWEREKLERFWNIAFEEGAQLVEIPAEHKAKLSI